jgi:hypothetical protein
MVNLLKERIRIKGTLYELLTYEKNIYINIERIKLHVRDQLLRRANMRADLSELASRRFSELPKRSKFKGETQ